MEPVVWIRGLPAPDSLPVASASPLSTRQAAEQQSNDDDDLLNPYLGQPQVFCFFFSKKKHFLF